MTGIILKGRYCIVDQIGSGGEGRMYLARDLELGIFRAVKELPISNRREAGLLRLLEHPALPKMIDYAEREGFCYIIMEYIQGKSLAQLLKEGTVFSLEEVLQIGDTVLNVLDYLHSGKPAVFYGDLKPDNLMITPVGTLYLVDFGSAVFEYQRHSSGQNVRGREVLQLRSSIMGWLIRRVIFTVLVRHWSVCAEDGNGDIFCDARISESLSLNAVARKQENAGRMRQKQESFLIISIL